MSLNSYNITKLSLVYGLFNQYLFNEAKSNIDLVERYYMTDPSTMDNTLIRALIDAIRKYDFEAIDEPVFKSILSTEKKTDSEAKDILEEIIKYKCYDQKQIDPVRNYLRSICYQSIISQANSRFKNDPQGFVNFLKASDYHADYSNVLSTCSFNDIQISPEDAQLTGGWASTSDLINQSYKPLCKWKTGQIAMICMPPGCMRGDTEIFLADGSSRTLKDLYESDSRNLTVYSNDGVDPKVSVAEKCIITKYVTEWYVVSIDNKDFYVTDDHRFMMIDGSYKKASELSVGDSLMPMNFVNLECGETQESTGYYTSVYSSNKFRRFYSHRLTGEYIRKKSPEKYPSDRRYVSHHDSQVNGKFNRTDNRVESIKVMDPYRHLAYHGHIAMIKPERLEKFLEKGVSTRFISEVTSSRNHKNWKLPEYREFMRSVTSSAGKKIASIRNSKDDEFNGTRQRIMSSLKYGKYLIESKGYSTTEQLLENWDKDRVNPDGSYSIGPRTPSRRSVERYFGDRLHELYELCLSYNNHTITGIRVEATSSPEPAYDIYNVDFYSNYTVKFDENSGFVSHNCGKTLFLMNEELGFCLQGARVHHIALGDMKESDFVLRMAAIYSGLPFDQVAMNINVHLANLKKAIGDKLSLTCVPSASVTADQYIEYMRSRLDDYDVIVIDYDTRRNWCLKTSLTAGNSYHKIRQSASKIHLSVSKDQRLSRNGVQIK